jgi:hypothetical protein
VHRTRLAFHKMKLLRLMYGVGAKHHPPGNPRATLGHLTFKMPCSGSGAFINLEIVTISVNNARPFGKQTYKLCCNYFVLDTLIGIISHRYKPFGSLD